jgi:molybdenum-dependent DNA-binding transcriptional regulator ModE
MMGLSRNNTSKGEAMKLSREEAIELRDKHGGIRAAARAIGVAHSTIAKAINGRNDVASSISLRPAQPERKGGRSLAEFRSTYDKATIIPAKIKEALKALGNGWEYEADFARIAKVSTLDLGRFRDQYAAHVVTIGKDSRRAWAGTEKLAQEMRDML